MDARKSQLVGAFQKSVTAGITAFLLANGAMAATGPQPTPEQQREAVTARYDKIVAAINESGGAKKILSQRFFGTRARN